MAHDFSDEGVVIGTRKLGEHGVVLELFTREHGRHFGLVRGGASNKLKPLLQTGNHLSVHWRARLEEQLGTFQVELMTSRAQVVMGSPLGLYGLIAAAQMLRLAAEREPHPRLFQAFEVLARALPDVEASSLAALAFEMVLLTDLGFGLDLSCCAATGVTEDLVYISPKTGRAVSRGAGLPYHDRLFRLPTFLKVSHAGGALHLDHDELHEAFRVTAHFLEHHLCHVRGIRLPDERHAFIAALLEGMQKAA
jgi:DNA repair protein RecO (recombination protein O)